MQLQALPAEAAADKIAPDEKAKSTDDDEHADRQAHKRIGHRGRQGRKRRTHAHEVEACIAEGGDGVEHGGVDAAQNAKFRDEPDGKQCGTRKFEHERKGNDLADERRRTVERDVARRLHKDLAVIKAEAFAEQHGRQRDEGHEAETAELDEREDHELAEDRPAGERVADDETRHTGCTR